MSLIISVRSDFEVGILSTIEKLSKADFPSFLGLSAKFHLLVRFALDYTL